MQALPPSLAPLGDYRQFIIWKAVPDPEKPGKIKKIPTHFQAGYPVDVTDSSAWADANQAIVAASAWGDEYGVGFCFTPNDPFFFLDIDGCRTDDDANPWSPMAMDLMRQLPGVAIEVSQSGKGLHLFGTGTCPPHGCRNRPLGLELYTEARFVALTGINAIGDASMDASASLGALVAGYFPPTGGAESTPGELTTEPVPQWSGPADDDELIAKALASKQSAAATFGGASSFASLWGGSTDGHDGDESLADASLAQHLAFWTGSHGERMLRLMRRSGLVRPKWEREAYLILTINFAVSKQTTFYNVPTETATEDPRARKIKASSDKQAKYAESIRASKIAQCGDNDEWVEVLCKISKAKFWLDNKDLMPGELVAMVQPVKKVTSNLFDRRAPEIVSGFQYLGATLQLEHFKGCVYVQDLHRVMTAAGTLLKRDQFDATYGGYSFQMDDSGDKTSDKPWDVFTRSQVVRFPKAETTCFRPAETPGAILVGDDGHTLLNTYFPIETPRQSGDATPFLNHLAKLLPDPHDQTILLAYMAACLQYKGVKFQWAPLLQGAEGNGKTLFSRCVAFAVGEKYTHLPPATEIAEKYNAWLFDKLFIGVEDVYVPDHKKEIIEVLKPMITNNRLACRDMGVGQVMRDVTANFLLNSNHKDAIRKTQTDRRFAVFFTAQQSPEDFVRDDMTGSYFPELYAWLRGGGYAIVATYLDSYPIPDELNPAGACHRAPPTSSTAEAIEASMGGVEQEVLEAVEAGRTGFRGGWISSIHLDTLLKNLRMDRAIPHNKRRELLRQIGYEPHPAMKDGRANNVVLTDNGKPRLFAKVGCEAAQVSPAAAAVKAYEAAQAAPSAEIVLFPVDRAVNT
jgi:hypothetical protein